MKDRGVDEEVRFGIDGEWDLSFATFGEGEATVKSESVRKRYPEILGV